MADRMSFDKYIDNPSGGSVITNRNMYKNMYKSKFDNILLREQGNIKYQIYHADDAIDSYYIHIKIPSEVISNFYYDVVIHLFTTEKIKKASNNLRRYAVEFYSNDPAFVYTFAHSFLKNKLFIKDLESKMSKQALTHKAFIKNPKDNVWYVKSLYFAYLTMEKYNLFARAILDKNAKKYSKKVILSNIEHADKKVKARQDEQEKLNKEKNKEKKKEEIRRNAGVSTNTTKQSSTIKRTKTTQSTKKTSFTKKTKIATMKKRP